MAVIKCKMCGGDLNLTEGASTAECEYCGSVQTIPKVDDEKKLTLFARANRLRIACEFDKAAGIYESIVADFPEEAEAYWGLVLCNYGIEYVDDPATGKKIPTCHRSSFDSIMEDSDFEQALENADPAARRVYREEAKQIEEIRKGIISVSSNEQPYDIFICYKETDVNGDRTLDSVLAQDVYDALTDKGYRVFFSRITLEDKLGMEYEPYIFAALNSAKIMLAFGTDFEYYNAVWVKNEWSRYLKLMAKDKAKHLIPCYKGIDAYDMPKEFAKLQAQDLGKVGATQDLLRGIEKLLPKDTVKETVVVQQTVTTGNPTTESYLKRAFMFLEDGDWASAEEYCEKVLDIDPENARAYLGKLLAELQLRTQDELSECAKAFDTRNNYQKALRFADAALRKDLEAKLIAWQKREEEERIACQKREEEERISRQKREEEERIARQKREEEERIARQKRKEELKLIREKLKPAIPLLSAGICHTVGLKADGTVVAVGDNKYGQCSISHWTDIVAVCTGRVHTVGLKADGTVVAVGYDEDGARYVFRWAGIIAVCTGRFHTVGLKADGTVMATGSNSLGQCDVSGWTDIIAVAAGNYCTVGLKTDGTVVTVGNNSFGQCDVSNWTDIVAVSAGGGCTIGLKADGTVVAVGANDYGQCNVSSWTDIIAISAGLNHAVGLKADGTVVAVGENGYGQCNVSGWTDVVAVSTKGNHTVGLKADGTVVAVGDNKYGQCNVAQWKLFESIDNLEQERTLAREKREQERIAQKKREEEERLQHRNAGLCQHCGGQLKGLFSKKCVSCGRPKDY